MRPDELRLTVLRLFELEERLLLRFTDGREELLLLERFILDELREVLRLGVTLLRLEEVAGRETSLLLLLLRLGATLRLLDVDDGREISLLRLVEALLLRVVGRFASRLRVFTLLERFKLSERPLLVRILAVLRFAAEERLPTATERRVVERFTDELRLPRLGVTAAPLRVVLPLRL